ncbi:MAG: ABC transporter permease subunit, partial [Clostridia bacterium]|nr:ABC transporter permease subunit [Clostridia bacterium]
MTQAIQEYSQKQVEQRLIDMNIDLQILQPVSIVPINEADENAGGNFMLMMIVPMLASILIAVGGIPAATDLVAGEKERATFEPLLTTQAGRMSILLGKYMTVTMFSFVSVIAQLIGLLIG